MKDYKYTDSGGATYDVAFKLTAKEASNPQGMEEKDPEGNSYSVEKAFEEKGMEGKVDLEVVLKFSYVIV